MSAPAGDEKKDPTAPAPAKQPPLAPKRKIRKPPGKPAFEIVSRVYQGNDDSLALVLVQSATKLYAGLSVDYARKPEEMPRVTVPNVYGYRDETFSRNEMFFNEALEQRNSLNLVWPLQRGVVEDWEALEKIWRRLFLNPKLELDVRIEVRKKDAPPVEEDGFAAAAAVAAKKAAKKKKGDVDESDEDDSLTKTDTAAVFKMSKNFWNVSMKNEQLSTSDKDNLQKAGLLGQKLAKLKGSQDSGIVKQGNAGAPAGGGGASSNKGGGASGAGTDPDEEILQHPLLNRYPILITEAPWTTKLDRERMAKILFDTFDAVAIAVCQTPSLVLASHGRSTGCIVDLGETVTSAVCVFEGYLMAHTVQKQDWGGKKVVELLLRYLRTEQNIEFFGEEWRQEQAGAEVLRKMGFVLTNGPTEMQLCPPKNYECKMTGRIHSIKTERCRCIEALFQPSMFKRPLTNAEEEEEKYKKMLGILSPEVNYQQYALHELVFHSINAAHYKTRAALYENIILTGGLSRVTNLAERLKRELGKMPFVRAMMNVTHELLPMYDEQKEFDAIMKQLRAEQQQMSSDLDGSRLSIGSGQGSVLSEESLASTLANSFTSINPGGLPRPGQRKKSIGMKIRIHEPPAELRDFDCDTTEAYLGAAALASMDSFEQLHFTRKEYDSEEGLSTLHGKVV